GASLAHGEGHSRPAKWGRPHSPRTRPNATPRQDFAAHGGRSPEEDPPQRTEEGRGGGREGVRRPPPQPSDGALRAAAHVGPRCDVRPPGPGPGRGPGPGPSEARDAPRRPSLSLSSSLLPPIPPCPLWWLSERARERRGYLPS